MHRNLRGLLLFVACSVACSSPFEEGGQQEDEVKAKVHATLSIPLAEVSGLARREVNGQHELLAIGDTDYALVVGSYSNDAVEDATFTRVDLQEPFADYVQEAGSQWEAIAADGVGRVFVLEENPGRLFVIEPALSSLERVISLRVEANAGVPEDTAKEWANTPNSRGEGLVLLANGHVLVLKEKRERALLEFGPEGSEPAGYRAEFALAGDAEFPLPNADELVALRAWPLGKPNKMPDASELALDLDGSLLVLSDEGRLYARAVLPVEPSAERIELDELVKIPECDKPEGMTVLANGRVVVASDQKKLKKNAVVLRN